MKPDQHIQIDQIEELDCVTTDNAAEREMYGYSSDVRQSLDPQQMIQESDMIVP